MRGPGNDLREIGFSSEIQRFSCRIGRRGSLMVRSLDSRLSATSLSPGRGHVVLLLSKTLKSHRISLYLGISMATGKCFAGVGGSLCDVLPSLPGVE